MSFIIRMNFYLDLVFNLRRNKLKYFTSNEIDINYFVMDEFDYIIIDTPPIGLVTDAYLLMDHSDVNLFIVRQRYTNKKVFGSIIKFKHIFVFFILTA